MVTQILWLQYHVLTLSIVIVHKTVMVPLILLYPCLPGGGSVLATPQTIAGRCREPVCWGAHVAQNYDLLQ